MEILSILMKVLDFLFFHEKTFNRFRWSTDNIDALLQCLKNVKAHYEFIGLDFASDFVKLCTRPLSKSKTNSAEWTSKLNFRSNFTLNLLQII